MGYPTFTDLRNISEQYKNSPFAADIVGETYRAAGANNLAAQKYEDARDLQNRSFSEGVRQFDVSREDSIDQFDRKLKALLEERDRRFALEENKNKFAQRSSVLGMEGVGTQDEWIENYWEPMGFSTGPGSGVSGGSQSSNLRTGGISTGSLRFNSGNSGGTSRGTLLSASHNTPIAPQDAWSFDPTLEAETNRDISYDNAQERSLDLSLAQSAKEDDDWWNIRLGYA